jgi:hypothetical protein
VRVPGQIHQDAISIHQLDAIRDSREGDRRAFTDLHCNAIWQKPHYSRGLDPGNFLELSSTLFKRNKEDVASYIATQDLYYLRATDLIEASAIPVRGAIRNCDGRKDQDGNKSDSEPTSCFFRQRSSADGNTAVSAAKLRLGSSFSKRRLTLELRGEFVIALQEGIDASG